MQRIYTHIINEHFNQYRQMLFLMGPRQSGKTTTAQNLEQTWKKVHYFSWDNASHREQILAGNTNIAKQLGLEQLSPTKPIIIFDEIHKYSDWKLFLKGLYDSYPAKAHILVTGSTKLDVYKKGGDSLMGRYFMLRHHPLSLAELLYTQACDKEIRAKPKAISETDFNHLWEYGGYPDPFIYHNKRFYNRWRKLQQQQLFREDIRDLSRVEDLTKLELLATLLTQQVGQLVSANSLAKKIKVTNKTIDHWLHVLQSVYYCFAVRPWSKNITRSLLKEPKYYVWDWSLCKDVGARAENFVAAHLLKAIHFWKDYGLGDYGLYFLRDKSKREVDFLIAKDEQPWILIEVKYNHNQSLTPNLRYFQQQLKAPYALQVAFNLPFVDKSCFLTHDPIIVPVTSLLSQLV